MVEVHEGLAIGLESGVADVLFEPPAGPTRFDPDGVSELGPFDALGTRELHVGDLELAARVDRDPQDLLIGLDGEFGADLGEQKPGLLEVLHDLLGQRLGLCRMDLLSRGVRECVFGDLQTLGWSFQFEAKASAGLDPHHEIDLGAVDASLDREDLRLPVAHRSQIGLGSVPETVFEPRGELCAGLVLGAGCGLHFLIIQALEDHRPYDLRCAGDDVELHTHRVGFAVEIEVGLDHRVGKTTIVETALHPPPARLDAFSRHRVADLDLHPAPNS